MRSRTPPKIRCVRLCIVEKQKPIVKLKHVKAWHPILTLILKKRNNDNRSRDEKV